LLTHILDAAGCITNVQINSNEQHTIFTHKLQVHWGWWWDFPTFIANCSKSVISV